MAKCIFCGNKCDRSIARGDLNKRGICAECLRSLKNELDLLPK